jgi:hypothetical protein
MYDKFGDKIDALKGTITKVPNQGSSKKWLYNTNLTEPFDVAEIEGTSNSEPLVEPRWQ